MDANERAELAADLKTATLSGGGFGLALLGLLIPVLSIIGLFVSFIGWRSARPEYRPGRVFGVLGMAVGFLGTALLLVQSLGAL